MLREFFCVKKHIWWAWGGMALIVVHAVYKAWLAVRFTAWYRDFYDVMQAAAAAVHEAASGDRMSELDEIGTKDELGSNRIGATSLADVYAQLLTFCELAVPAAIVHPIAIWFQSQYALNWRLALVNSYLVRWEGSSSTIEGASQRVQEDTQRFAEGLELACVTILDTVFTLVIFTPRLVDIGEQLPPPDALRGFAAFFEPWLVWLALALALCGTFIGLIIAHHLVELEVRNQLVEAALRKDLVIWETCVPPVNPPAATPVTSATSAMLHLNASAEDGVEEVHASAWHGARWLPDLKKNYSAIYKHFGYLNVWVGAFEQAVTVVPYLLAAPQLLAETNRTTLGTVVEFARVFDRVFEALTVPMHNWGRFNEFRSVVRRLSEFERVLPPMQPPKSRPRSSRSSLQSREGTALSEIAVPPSVVRAIIDPVPTTEAMEDVPVRPDECDSKSVEALVPNDSEGRQGASGSTSAV